MTFVLYHVTFIGAEAWRCESVALRPSLRLALRDIPPSAVQVGRRLAWRVPAGYFTIKPVRQVWYPGVGSYLVTVDSGAGTVRYKVQPQACDLGA